MITFWKLLVNSLASPPFYASIPRRPFTQALLYFLFLTFLIAVVRVGFLDTVSVATVVAPRADPLAEFPPDLEIELRDGEAFVAGPEPYILPDPTLDRPRNGEQPANILVIDTQTSFSPEQAEEYSTMFWMTRTALMVRQDVGVYQELPLETFPDVVISRQSLQEFRETTTFRVMLVFFFLGYFSLIYAGMLFRLVYLLLIAFPLMLLGRLFGLTLEYGQAYKVGLFAVTAGFLAEIAVLVVNLFTPFQSFPFMFTLATLLVVLINWRFVAQMQKESTDAGKT